MGWVLLITCGWAVCGALAYAIQFGDMCTFLLEDTKEERRYSQGFAALMGLFGPIGLVVSLGTSGFVQHGLKWRCDP